MTATTLILILALHPGHANQQVHGRRKKRKTYGKGGVTVGPIVPVYQKAYGPAGGQLARELQTPRSKAKGVARFGAAVAGGGSTLGAWRSQAKAEQKRLEAIRAQQRRRRRRR